VGCPSCCTVGCCRVELLFVLQPAPRVCGTHQIRSSNCLRVAGGVGMVFTVLCIRMPQPFRLCTLDEAAVSVQQRTPGRIFCSPGALINI
jgi:hypothetical protein